MSPMKAVTLTGIFLIFLFQACPNPSPYLRMSRFICAVDVGIFYFLAIVFLQLSFDWYLGIALIYFSYYDNTVKD